MYSRFNYFPNNKHLLFYFFSYFLLYIICQIKRDKTFHLRNSKKLLMVFGN
ncbi:IS256 family transposase, partial [Enterococcus faecium]